MANVDELELDEIRVPGDLSSAAFLLAAGVLVPGSRLLVRDVGVNWTRAGFVRILQRMGARRRSGTSSPRPRRTSSRPRSRSPTSTCGPGRSWARRSRPQEVPLAIDELPLVALLGCFAEGETVVRGAAELRLKESDRIAAVVEGLRGLGAEIEATEDGFAVPGTGGLRGGVMAARGDHRLAMLGAVAGLASREGVTVQGMDAAAISYPLFLEHLATLA